MQKTVAFITGLVVLAHSVLGCCALEAEHHGTRAQETSQLASVDGSRIDPADGGHHGHEHECCHLSCQWIAPSGVDRADGPQRDFVLGSTPAHICATCVAFAATHARTEAPPGAAPPVRRHLQLGVLLI
jgi:hypothetical protein